MQVNTTPEVTLPKSGALGPYLRVVLVNNLLALAGPFDREIGTTKQNYLSSGLGQGAVADTITRHAPGTVMMTASGAISQYADVYADVNGKVTANTTGYYIGVAMEAASGDGAWLEVMRVDDRGGMAFITEAASTVITNTNVETAFSQSFTIPANSLKVGDFIHILAHVTCPSTNSTDTLTIKLKIGTTIIVATAAVDVANGDIAVIDAILVVRTVGANGTFVACGSQQLGTPGTATVRNFNLASTAIDTTADKAITVTATWSVANAGDQCQLDILSVNATGG